jgi:hypothetical protein
MKSFTDDATTRISIGTLTETFGADQLAPISSEVLRDQQDHHRDDQRSLKYSARRVRTVLPVGTPRGQAHADQSHHEDRCRRCCVRVGQIATNGQDAIASSSKTATG